MMAVVCSELQEDYFLSSIATTLFTDMEEGEVTSEDNSCEYHIITRGGSHVEEAFIFETS